MMKKVATVLLCLSVFFALCFIAACGENVQPEPHVHTEEITTETQGKEIFSVKKCSICGEVLSSERIARYIADGLLLDLNDTSSVTIDSALGLKNFNSIMTSNYTPPSGYTSIPKNSFAKKTFVLSADVDLKDYEWNPISIDADTSGFTFDGNGHIIENLQLSGTTDIGFFGTVSANLTVKNLNFKNARLTTAGKWCGILVGHQEGGLLTVENVNFSECSVLGTVEPKAIRLGCIIGYCLLSPSKISIKNCTVENCSFSGYHNTCALIGTLAGAQAHEDNWSVTGCSVKNNTFSIGTSVPKYVNPYTVDTSYMSREDMEKYIEERGNSQQDNRFEYEVTENSFTPVS